MRIALLGMGTVGGGVYELAAKKGIEVVRVLERVRRTENATTDIADIADDPRIEAVAEMLGGVEPAREYALRCIRAGKHFVTANKLLISRCGIELAREAQNAGVRLVFSAACGGGIPFLPSLVRARESDRIVRAGGILNGTTNYILTRMVRTGAFFTDALREAQAKGYAEADPTADVEGIDAGRKICILADLAFGHQVEPDKVPMEGITKLSLRDVKIAQRAGYRIKLLGRAVRLPGGGRTAYVAPHLIPEENPIANVEDVFNAVMVKGNATGEVMFYGKGAGELPTASACVADVMECLQASPKREEIGWSDNTDGFEDPLELHTRYYFRIEGSLTDAAMAFGQVEVLSEDGETAFLTDRISGQDAMQQAKFLNVLASMRVLS